jgi:hypothetical protein
VGDGAFSTAVKQNRYPTSFGYDSASPTGTRSWTSVQIAIWEIETEGASAVWAFAENATVTRDRDAIRIVRRVFIVFLLDECR